MSEKRFIRIEFSDDQTSTHPPRTIYLVEIMNTCARLLVVVVKLTTAVRM